MSGLFQKKSDIFLTSFSFSIEPVSSILPNRSFENREHKEHKAPQGKELAQSNKEAEETPKQEAVDNTVQQTRFRSKSQSLGNGLDSGLVTSTDISTMESILFRQMSTIFGLMEPPKDDGSKTKKQEMKHPWTKLKNTINALEKQDAGTQAFFNMKAALFGNHEWRDRDHIFREIIKSEEIYCMELETCIHLFMIPLSDYQLISKTEHERYFECTNNGSELLRAFSAT